jgi:hypothetical protein
MPDDPTITDEQPQSHRAGAWVVLLMGLAGLGLGLFQWHGSFAAAFAHEQSTFRTPEQIETERIEGTKSKDTDRDGLSDYDESYIYKTSPYLKDSDSDGTEDNIEVAQGSDPNCQKGKSCVVTPTMPAPNIIMGATSTDEAPDPNLLQEDVLNQIMNPTPEQIRAMLLQAGMKPEDLQGIGDEALIELYKQSLLEVQTRSNASSSP